MMATVAPAPAPRRCALIPVMAIPVSCEIPSSLSFSLTSLEVLTSWNPGSGPFRIASAAPISHSRRRSMAPTAKPLSSSMLGNPIPYSGPYSANVCSLSNPLMKER